MEIDKEKSADEQERKRLIDLENVTEEEAEKAWAEVEVRIRQANKKKENL